MSVPELPHDTFAEEYVLASCLKWPDLVALCRLAPRDFYHLAHRQAWAAILEVGADLDELGAALHYGPASLALWQADWSLPSQGAIAAAARIRDCARHRELARVAQRLAERAWGCEPAVDRERLTAQAAASGTGPASSFWAISRSGVPTRSACHRSQAISLTGSSSAPATVRESRYAVLRCSSVTAAVSESIAWTWAAPSSVLGCR